MNNKILAYVLLVVGIALAAAFGARNGATHTAYRSADGLVQVLSVEAGSEAEQALRDEGVLKGDLEEAQAAAAEKRDSVGLPVPSTRLVEWFSAGGLGWLIGVVFVAAGAFLARRERAIENAGGGDAAGDRADFATSLDAVLETLGAINEQIASLPMDEDAPAARDRIDLLTTEVLEPVVEARGSYVARHGLGTFAEYFGHFAAGERNLARCWSALTDGHAEVARSSLATSISYFELAREAWDRAEAA